MGQATATLYVIECPASGATLGAGTVNADGINVGTERFGDHRLRVLVVCAPDDLHVYFTARAVSRGWLH
jgi:hypothetical protein